MAFEAPKEGDIIHVDACNDIKSHSSPLRRSFLELGKPIQRGGSSIVFELDVCAPGGEELCAKVFTANNATKYRDREMLLMNRVTQRGPTENIGARTQNELPVIIMKRVKGIDLIDYVNGLYFKDVKKREKRKTLMKFKKRFFETVYHLLTQIAFIHGNNVVHLDIKPDNVIYDKQSRRLTLIDFGISKVLPEDGSPCTLCSSRVSGSKSPETALHDDDGTDYPKILYPKKFDMWCLGIVLYVFLFGGLPFNTSSNFNMSALDSVCSSDDVYGDLYTWLREHLLRRDPTERSSAVEALVSLSPCSTR